MTDVIMKKYSSICTDGAPINRGKDKKDKNNCDNRIRNSSDQNQTGAEAQAKF